MSFRVGNVPSSTVEADIEAILVVRAICETNCEAFVRDDDIFDLYKRRSGVGVSKPLAAARASYAHRPVSCLINHIGAASLRLN